MITKIIKNAELLDTVYREWTREKFSSLRNPRKSYQSVPRWYSLNQEFERYLFEKGFTVVQENRSRYLKFAGEEEDLFFFLISF